MNDEWGTPKDLFQLLNRKFGFHVDVCASEDNYKTKPYWTKEDNALAFNWRLSGVGPRTVCWMNPPYSRHLIDKFVDKAIEQSHKGCTVVCLVRLDPTTKWFKKLWSAADEVMLLSKRLKFEGADHSYPFPSCVVVIRDQPIHVKYRRPFISFLDTNNA